MRIYYFVHLTGRDTGSTGIQRVVRNLGRALQGMPNIELFPVRWDDATRSIVHAEKLFFDCVAMFGGPVFAEAANVGKAISIEADEVASSWLLVPEVPHLKSHDARFPSVSLDVLIGYARNHNLRSAVIFHDLLPLTEPYTSSASLPEVQAFAIYGHALANADLIFPVSRTTGQSLLAWFKGNGFRPSSLPRFKPIPLAEEITSVARRSARSQRRKNPYSPFRFLSLGTICRRKNQLKAMEAFNRLRLRRSELRLEYHIVGTVDPELAGSVGRMLRRASGSIKMHGFVSDERAIQFLDESDATIFVSVAEGFGLPIAESLWLGKPVVCSDVGAMAEISQGGGCIPVNPSDLGQIEQTLERLVTDADLYDELLASIDSRDLRTWNKYGADLTASLTEAGPKIQEELTNISLQWAATQPAKPIIRDLIEKLEPEELHDLLKLNLARRGRADAVDLAPSLQDGLVEKLSRGDILPPAAPVGQKCFFIDLDSLKFHDAYLKRGKFPIFDQRVIRFTRDGFDRFLRKVQEPHLFYGPYLSLAAGRYMFSIDGELTGSVMLKFSKNFGETIKEVTVENLGEAILVELETAAENFEIIAVRLPGTESLVVRAIFVEYAPMQMDQLVQ